MIPKALLQLPPRLPVLAVALFTFGPWSPALAAADSDRRLEMTDRAELIELLERSQAETLRLVADLDEAAWKRRPAADRWSIGEVVEHLILAEGAVMERIAGLIEGGPGEYPVPTEPPQPTLADLVAIGADRTQRFEAPAAIQPQSARSKKEVLRDFIARRAESIHFVLETAAPLRSVAAPTPIGQVLDGGGWLGLLGAHNLRHNRQVVEVRQQLGLPAVE